MYDLSVSSEHIRGRFNIEDLDDQILGLGMGLIADADTADLLI